jgi:hypothetical protein
VVGDTLDAKRLVFASNSVDKVVEGDGHGSSISSDIGGVYVKSESVWTLRSIISRTLESDSLLDRVDLLCLGLVDGHLSLLVSGDESSWLDDTSGLKGTDGNGWQEGREEEVVSGRDNDDVELLSVDVLQERRCSPSGSKDDQSWLGGIVVELLSRVRVFLGDYDRSVWLLKVLLVPLTIDESTGGTNEGDKSESTKVLHPSPPFTLDWGSLRAIV